MKKRINTGLDEESEWTHVQHRVLYVIKVLLWSKHGPSQRPLSAPITAAAQRRRRAFQRREQRQRRFGASGRAASGERRGGPGFLVQMIQTINTIFV